MHRYIKKVSSAVLSLIVLFSMVTLNAPVAASGGGFGGGNGSPGSPYIITDAADLNAVRLNLSASYVMGGNIDMTAYLASGGDGFALWGDSGWLPVGDSANPFTGSLDGAGYSVIGLTVSRPSADYVGLFGCIGSGGAVKNLNTAGPGIAGHYEVAGIAGCNYGTVDNCFNACAVSGNADVGGVAGINSNGTVQNCRNSGAVADGVSDIGGVVGHNYFGTVKNCLNTGSVTGGAYVTNTGGVVAFNSGTLQNCRNTGAVAGYLNAGGVAGYNDGKHKVTSTVTYCYNTGSVAGNIDVGGVVGDNISTNTVGNCYNTGSVTGGNYAGGVAGVTFDAVANCYSAGPVTGTGNYVGGSVGELGVGGSVTNCYFNIDNYTGVDNGYGFGRTTAGMTDNAALTTYGALPALGVAFVKRANDAENLYYPELVVFKNSADSVIASASKVSVTVAKNAPGGDISAYFTDLNLRAAIYAVIGKTAPAPILDTDVTDITTLNVSNRNIQSLAGLSYLIGLTTFSCDGNQIKSLSALPPGLTSLTCSGNQLTSLALASLPSGLTVLDCGNNPIAALPALPSGLTKLICSGDGLSTLPALPAGLKYLDCNNNLLTALPALPLGLESIDVNQNKLTALPALPPGLTEIYCNNNRLTQLDVTGLPLKALDCRFNYLTAVIGFGGAWDNFFYLFNPQNTPPQPSAQHTVIFMSNGSQFAEFILNDGQMFGTDMPAPPTNPGYNFVGYFTGQQGTGTQLTTITPIVEDMTVYAYWNSVIPATMYTVTFMSDGVQYTSRTVSGGAAVGMAMPSVPSKEGYTFGGWFTGDSGSGTAFTFDTGVTGDLVVYAYWKVSLPATTVNIVAVAWANGTATGSGAYNVGDTVTVTALLDPGNAFDGWYEAGIKVSGDNPYTFIATADRQLWALFFYNIQIVAGIGGTVSGDGGYHPGDSVTLTATPNSGYSFDGWYENNTSVSSNAVYTFVASANRTLEARFDGAQPLNISIDNRLVITPVNRETTNSSFSLHANADVSGRLIVASYDAKGRLVSTAVQPFSLSADGETTVQAYITEQIGGTYRFFIWDSAFVPMTVITSIADLP